MRRTAVLLFALSASGCSQRPEPPDDPVAMAALADEIVRVVEPGFTLRPHTAPRLWDELYRLGAYGAEVQPDSSAVVIRMNGFPRNYGYFYRLREPDEGWERKARRLELHEVNEQWYWYVCEWGRRMEYPC